MANDFSLAKISVVQGSWFITIYKQTPSTPRTLIENKIFVYIGFLQGAPLLNTKATDTNWKAETINRVVYSKQLKFPSSPELGSGLNAS